MEYIGIKWKRFSMLAFCGQDACSIDANGRLKLSPEVIEDFMSADSGNVVMHCLPEGAIALYPEHIYKEMRAQAHGELTRLGESLLQRRLLRRFGAMSENCRITGQGRVTIPPAFRDYAGLAAGGEARVIGIEVGVEIWSKERWEAELAAMNEHLNERGQLELAHDLV